MKKKKQVHWIGRKKYAQMRAWWIFKGRYYIRTIKVLYPDENGKLVSKQVKLLPKKNLTPIGDTQT